MTQNWKKEAAAAQPLQERREENSYYNNNHTKPDYKKGDNEKETDPANKDLVDLANTKQDLTSIII
jgi:hypothetical protein